MRLTGALCCSIAAGSAFALCPAVPASAFTTTAARMVVEGRRPAHEEVLRVVSRIVEAGYQGPSGFVQGATLVFAEDLFWDDVRIGRTGGVCTVTATRPDGSGDAQCSITSVLPDGDLAYQGRFPVRAAQVGDAQRAVLAGDFDVAIAGGTGRYRTARGFLHGHPLDERTTRVEVHLIQ